MRAEIWFARQGLSGYVNPDTSPVPGQIVPMCSEPWVSQGDAGQACYGTLTHEPAPVPPEDARSYGERMRARYPDAEQAWRAAPPHPGGVPVSLVPWLPYDAPTSTGFYYFPSPGPGNFNFGGHDNFEPTPQGFAGDNWRELIADAGGNPDAEYMSAFMQSPMPGAGKYDYLQVLYMRSGPYWRPIAAYHKGRTSSWVEFREGALKPYVGLLFAFGLGPMLAAKIGPALMGPTFTAANPGVTSAIGQTVMQTAMNGGDLGQAVKSLAASYAGSVAGAQLAQLADSPALGKVSSAALATAIKGGDVQSAVLQSLATTGAQSLGELLTPDAGMPAASADFSDASTYTAEQMTAALTPQTGEPMFASADYFDPVYTEDAAAPVLDVGSGSWSATDWSAPLPANAASWWETDPAYQLPTTAFDPSGMDTAAVQTTALPQSSPSFEFPSLPDNWIADLTNVAMAAIKVNAAYQATKAPAPRTVTQSGQTTATPNANGTVTVRNAATGQVSTQLPPKGVPYVLPDGTTIINNGNGTYDVIYPTGSKVTRSYSGTAGVPGGASFLDSLKSIPPAAWGVGAALLLFALKSRR